MKNRQMVGKCRFNAPRSGSWYNQEEMYGKMALRRAKERKNFYSWNNLSPVKGIETRRDLDTRRGAGTYLE
jgi:hypothetical protein